MLGDRKPSCVQEYAPPTPQAYVERADRVTLRPVILTVGLLVFSSGCSLPLGGHREFCMGYVRENPAEKQVERRLPGIVIDARPASHGVSVGWSSTLDASAQTDGQSTALEHSGAGFSAPFSWKWANRRGIHRLGAFLRRTNPSVANDRPSFHFRNQLGFGFGRFPSGAALDVGFVRNAMIVVPKENQGRWDLQFDSQDLTSTRFHSSTNTHNTNETK